MRQVTHRPASVWGALLLAALLCSCAQANSLEGSLTEIMDLGFTTAALSFSDCGNPLDPQTCSSITLIYSRPNGKAQDIVFKLVALTAPRDVTPGQAINLGPADDGTARANVTRSVGGDPVAALAAIKSGELTINAPLEMDKPNSGDFRVTFTGPFNAVVSGLFFK